MEGSVSQALTVEQRIAVARAHNDRVFNQYHPEREYITPDVDLAT
jgi:hypothetical protein